MVSIDLYGYELLEIGVLIVHNFEDIYYANSALKSAFHTHTMEKEIKGLNCNILRVFEQDTGIDLARLIANCLKKLPFEEHIVEHFSLLRSIPRKFKLKISTYDQSSAVCIFTPEESSECGRLMENTKTSTVKNNGGDYHQLHKSYLTNEDADKLHWLSVFDEFSKEAFMAMEFYEELDDFKVLYATQTCKHNLKILREFLMVVK